MTKVIKGEFKKLETLKINDVSLTCDTSLENFHDEFNRLSNMDDDLFTYEVEIEGIANIPCDLNKDDDSKQQISQESDDDMEYDPSDVEFTAWTFKEFNYLLQIDPNVLTKDIEGFKTYDKYKDDWIYEWNENMSWDSELKEEASRNKAILEGLINEDDESSKNDEEYVAIKEDEYEGLMNTSKGAIHAYQEIFRMMDEG
ncbi:hypothetical protein Tco_1157228 [Tanacetum coccineum]